jgi:putative Mn2+ efflux pump MntP
MAKQKRGDSLIWGIILIVVGGIFLLQQFDVDVFDQVWRFWPVILIVLGANKLYLGLKERRERSETPARDKDHEI